VLLHDDNLYGFDYLKKVMDKATPLYQERLNSLTPPLRKIVQEMAFLWEACPTKTLVEKCRMESKLLSSNLKQLDRYGIVDTLETGKKNHLYRISERFFNMWLIVTQGNPDQRRRAKYLTLFLESWYDEQELRSLAREHLGALRNKKISFDKAMALSKGLSQSQFLPTEERDELIELTRALNPADEAAELPRKFSEIFAETKKLMDNGQYEAALATLQEIENEADGVKFYLMAWCFESLSKLREAENLYLQAIEKGHVDALNNLAVLYSDQGKTGPAEHLYLQAIEKGQVGALYNLAILYDEQGKTELAETLYLQAIENSHVDAMNNLAILYDEQGKTESAETLYLQAIEKGHVNAMYNLAILYKNQGKNELAETLYLQAIENSHVNAMYNLANLYKNQGKNQLAETLYLQAIEKGHVNTLNNLAVLYDEQGKTELAETLYLQAIEKGQVGALYNLAVLYAKQDKSEAAETLYLNAIEKGHVDSMNNLAILYAEQTKTESAETMYLQAIEKGDADAMNNLAILYYNQNQHPAKALTLMQQFLDATQDKDAYQSLVILELWNGQLDGLREKVERVLTQQKLEDLEDFINDLLHHQQVHLVLSLFESEEHGKALRQRYELLYYAALLLAGRTEDNLLLRIPPEVLPTVEEIVKKVREKQSFYGYGGG
jgi:TPR repeat protein